MSSGSGSTEPGRAPRGLCDSCRHQQLVPNTRGSVFSLCLRSKQDPAFPRYPRLPVLVCPGHEPEAGARETS
ncbi:MAG TPA: hypothetical protein VIT85_07140 [Solirubrobacterales bacterium]